MARVRTKLYLITGLLLSVLSISGCPRQTMGPDTTQLKPDGRVAFQREGFSIKPPEGYRDNGPSFWHFMNFLGPEEGDFTVNCTVGAHKDEGKQIEDAGPVAEVAMCKWLSNYHPDKADQGFVNFGGRKTYFCSGTYEWSGRAVKCLMYCLRGGNGRVYVIVYTAPVETFNRHRHDFEQSARTIDIEPQLATKD